MRTPQAGTVLVIEDDEDTRANLRDLLEMDGYEVATAATAREGLAKASNAHHLAIVLDRKLPDGSALDLLPRLRREAPESVVIIVTGLADLEGAIVALRHGAADYILKPLNHEALRASLNRIAERQRLEREKHRSETAFRLLLEATECVIFIVRTDLTLRYFSPFAEQLTGFHRAEVEGRNVVEVLQLQPLDNDEVTLLDRLQAGQPVRGIPGQIVSRDGMPRWLVWNVTRLDDYEGSPALMAVGQDITDLKHAQERAVQSERLAAVGQMVAGLAHESRNALQRSQACLEMLAFEVSDRPAALNLIQRIQSAQDHLTHLYEDVRGYAAPLRLDRQPCELSATWRAAWTHLAHQARHAEATLHESLGCEDRTCLGDPFRLEQVFRNIFENALAASGSEPRIEISCSADMLDGQDAVRVVIRDHGTGLAPEARERIFEPFFTTKIRGTGLGMAIVQRIIEAHGGRIATRQPDGAGTEIVLTLPRGKS